MRYLSVCSGIEAASVAWEPLGWTPLAFSEIEPFPRAVLQHHYPDVPLHGDFTKLRDEPWIVDADILVGGTPCQAFSVAGLRNSLADERGNLSLEFVRLADAIDDHRLAAGREPAVIVWENVPGVLSVKDNAFGCFLAALAGEDTPLVPPRGKWTNAGVVAGPARTVAWRILDAQYFGLAQRRRRVFVVASAREGFDPAAVLLEFEGLRRDTPPRREAGKGTAVSVIKGAAIGRKPEAGPQFGEHLSDGSCYTLNCVDQHAVAIENGSHWDDPNAPHPTLNQSHNTGGVGASNQELFSQRGAYLVGDSKWPAEIAPTLNAGGMGRQDCETETLVTHSPRAEGFDASGGGQMAVAFAQNTRDEVRLQGGDGQIVGALAAEPGMKQTTYVAIPGETGKGDAAPCVATIAVNETVGTLCAEAGPNTHGSRGVSGSQTMLSGYIQPTANMAVRRLTPVECERLQGFPDGYTMIPWKKKPAADCPDGPRYKALGNSMAVPCMYFIGRRIKEHLDGRI